MSEVWKVSESTRDARSAEMMQMSPSHYLTSAAVVALRPYLPISVGRIELRRAGRSPKRDI